MNPFGAGEHGRRGRHAKLPIGPRSTIDTELDIVVADAADTVGAGPRYSEVGLGELRQRLDRRIRRLAVDGGGRLGDVAPRLLDIGIANGPGAETNQLAVLTEVE